MSLRGKTHKSQTHYIVQTPLRQTAGFSRTTTLGWKSIVFLQNLLLIREGEKFQKSLQIGLSEFLELHLCRCAVFGVTGLGYIYIYNYSYRLCCWTGYILYSHVFLYKETWDISPSPKGNYDSCATNHSVISSGYVRIFLLYDIILILKNIAILSPRMIPS